MKLIIAIVQDKDSNRLSDEFNKSNIRATKLSTTGGFLKEGNTTFLIGIDDERVSEALALVEEHCQSREQYMTSPIGLDVNMDSYFSVPVPIQVGGATVFILPIESFHQF